jgi:murein DD-endopeptidase MepM/ murein hydrolase activator NlpD
MRKEFLIYIFVAFLILPFTVHSQTVDELQTKINQRNTDIANLEKEISQYQKQIESLGSQATSLSATIKSLDLNRKQLEAKISMSEDQIASKTYQIQQLQTQIGRKEGNIADDQRIIKQTFSSIYENDNRSSIETVLGSKSLAESLNAFYALGSLQNSLYDRINGLTQDKNVLEINKVKVEKAKKELQNLNSQLNDQRKIVLSTAAEKTELLRQTNQSESSYKRLLAQRKAQMIAFQKELFDYESALHILIDFGSLPKAGSKIFTWPLASVFITQQFGKTVDSQRLYTSGTHGGIDLRASIGTSVKAALGGTVTDIEKSYSKAGCQYGYWVLIKHPNGLSTLYAHLSLVNVQVGQPVSAGDVVGYSGNTGYSEGPHLHFGVYATAGVRVVKSESLSRTTSCVGVKTVAADPKAYLDPMLYLN